MTILYRIISIIINTVAMLLAISLVFSIRMLISAPVTLLSAFLIVSVILYAFFSSRFRSEVLQQHHIVKHGLKDWVRVNGIVTLVFSVITFLNVMLLLRNPSIFADAIKNFGVEMPLKSVNGFFIGMLIYAVLLFIHVLWTFALMKKNKDYFQ